MFLVHGCVFLLFLVIFIDAKGNWTQNLTGERCEWEGKNGTCINFWSCVTNAVDAVVHSKHPPVCDVKDGEVYACCTGCDVTANISSIVIIKKYGFILEKTGSKSYDQCLRYMQDNVYPCYHKLGFPEVDKVYHEYLQCYTTDRFGPFVAGGRDATREEFPHMALLGYGEDQESAEWLCGGTIISEWYILTAGHCRSSTQLGEVQFAALGILKRSDPPSLWQVYRVDTFTPHPEYRPPSKYHDIALIRTDRRISFSSAVLPACLPQEPLDSPPVSASATGWGQVKHRAAQTSDVLQKVWLRAYNASSCYEHYGPSRTLVAGFDHNTQLCYGDLIQARDTCEGDSGGPLQLDQCPHVVLGVTSAGHPCGFPGGAGLYTRVGAYVPWIESIVWP